MNSKQEEKWQAALCLKSCSKGAKQKRVYGGFFTKELDAAKKVNELCDEYNMEHKNPGIGSQPTEQKEIVKRSFCFYKKKDLPKNHHRRV